jgi:hypothetical protein
VLLAQTALPILSPRDAIFDPARNLLYVTTALGKIERYDLTTASFLAPWTIGTSLNGADITPDGSTLYVAESKVTADFKGVVHQVDLATGLSTDLTYTRYDAYEEGSLDVAIAGDGTAYVTNEWTSSYHTGPIVEIDTATGAVARSTKLFGEYHTEIARSADRTRIAVGRPYAGVQVFDAVAHAVTAKGGGSYLSGYNGAAAVSRDGHFVVTAGNNFGLAVIDDAGQPITNLPIGAAMSAFDPVHDRLYVASLDKVAVYDSNAWAALYSVDAQLAGGGFSPVGRMTVDPQGTRLAIVSPSTDSVDLVDVSPRAGIVVKLEVSGMVTTTPAGRPESFTVTARDGAGDVATGYRGTVYFDTGDPAATVPQPYTFTAADAGTHTFSITFRTPSTGQALTVIDPAAGLTARHYPVQVLARNAEQVIYNLGGARAYDTARGLLYVADGAVVRRYDPLTQRMLPAIDLGGFPPTDLDVSADNRFLYVGTSYRSMNYGWLLRVDLGTLAVTRLPFLLRIADEVGVQSLVTAANGRVIFNTYKDSAESYGYVRDYDPATGAFTVRTEFSFDGRLEERSVLSRSADHGTVYIGENYDSERAVYDSATNRITSYNASATAGPFGSLNRDGTLVVTGGVVSDRTLNPIRTFSTVGVLASAFDPLLPRLYAIERPGRVAVYDTGTWQKLFTFPTSVYVPDFNYDGRTRAYVSDDGRWLFYTTPGSVNVFPLFTRPVITSAAGLVAPGATFNVTVEARGPAGTIDLAYGGIAHASSTDPAAILPADAPFTAADAGRRTFPVTFNTPGRHSLTVTDPATGATAVLYDILVAGVNLDADGVLGIVTGDGNDTVSVAPTPAGDEFAVTVNGAPARLFPAAQVRRVDVVTFGGNDNVTLTRVPGGTADLGAGADTVNVTAGEDAYGELVISGGDEDDTAALRAAGPQPLNFLGGAGNDGVVLYGTAGNDTIALSDTSATVNGAALSATGVESFGLIAGAGNDTITGFAPRSQTITGSIDAGDGDDRITILGAGYGNPLFKRVTVFGGAGDDSLTLPPNSGSLTSYNLLSFFGDAGFDLITLNGDATATSYNISSTVVSCGNNSAVHSGVEALTVYGTDAANTFNISGGALLPRLTVDGLGGGDTFSLGSTPTTGYPTLLGGAGDDRLLAGAGATGTVRFDGGDGADSVTWSPSGSAALSIVAGAGGMSSAGQQVIAERWEAATINTGTGADTIRVIPAADVAFTVAAGNPTTSPGDKLLLDPVGAAGTTFTSTGTGAGTYTFSNRRPIAFSGVETRSVLPAVGAVAFDPGTPAQLQLPFSVDVGASLTAEDFQVLNRASGAAVSLTFAYDVTIRVALLTLPGLPDGDYRLTVPAADVTDLSNTPMSADFTFDFFVLAGDANHDRAVDFNDLVKLAQSYNTTGKTYADGDFNSDGAVDFNDLVILAQRYNTMLPPPPAAAPAPAAAASASVTKEKPKPVFSTTPVAKAKPVPAKPKPVARSRGR